MRKSGRLRINYLENLPRVSVKRMYADGAQQT